MGVASTNHDAQLHIQTLQGLDYLGCNIIGIAASQSDKYLASSFGDFAMPIAPAQKLFSEQRITCAQQKLCTWIALKVERRIGGEVLIQDHVRSVFACMAIIVYKKKA